MTEDFKTPDWTTLDALIFANRKLECLQELREKHGYDLAAALELFSSRYKILRSERPDCFRVGDDEYWEGFHA